MSDAPPKKNLVHVLNDMFESTKKKLRSSQADILKKCVIKNEEEMRSLGEKPCKICTLSRDGRGRCQRSMRIGGKKMNFRPWHICWIAKNGKAPTDLQYSHRCHEENCCEQSHGRWETDPFNKDRNRCKTASHVVYQDGTVELMCPHESPCLVPFFSKMK